MNMPSSTMVGTSRKNASQRSSSSSRCRRGGGSWKVVLTAVTAMRGSSSFPLPTPQCGEVSLPSPRERGEGESASDVHLLELVLGPLRGILGRHALHRLRVHVGDDVLGEHLGCL